MFFSAVSYSKIDTYHACFSVPFFLGIGDPTDTSIQLRPLEPASGQALARDLVLKTRRRKGLSDSIAVSKYLEDEVNHDFGLSF